jgi:hypothetical protein
MEKRWRMQGNRDGMLRKAGHEVRSSLVGSTQILRTHPSLIQRVRKTTCFASSADMIGKGSSAGVDTDRPWGRAAVQLPVHCGKKADSLGAMETPEPIFAPGVVKKTASDDGFRRDADSILAQRHWSARQRWFPSKLTMLDA